jgi:hypothetical protein
MAYPIFSRKHDDEVQLYAFDLLALEGDDPRWLPLSMRKANLERLLDRQPNGIFVAPYESGEIGPDLYRLSLHRGTGGHSVETPRSNLPRGSLRPLGQGQEPQPPGHAPRRASA